MELRFTAETPSQLRVTSVDTVEHQRLLGALTYLGLSEEPSEALNNLRADIAKGHEAEQSEAPTVLNGPVEFTTDPMHQAVLLNAARTTLRDIRRVRVLNNIVFPPAANQLSNYDRSTLVHHSAASDAERTLAHMEKVFSAQPLPAQERAETTVSQG